MRVVPREKPMLYAPSSLETFLAIPPLDPSGWEKSLSRIHEKQESFKSEIANVLHNYNASIGNDSLAFQNIQKFQLPHATCVFTGQQLGFMGGPSYAILKGISCLLLARRHQSIPFYWLATEDHDIDEIDHAYLMDELGNLKKHHLLLMKGRYAVEDLQILPNQRKVIKSFLDEVGQEDLWEELSPENSYAQMMARLLARVFRGTGMVFVEPRLLRSFSVPFFKREIEGAHAINEILQNTTRDLSKEGGKVQLDISEPTNLFMKNKSKMRRRIKVASDQFTTGDVKYEKSELLELIEKNPHLFSPNAASRPILQSLLFPVVAYVGGPGELAYHHQLKDYFSFHGVSMPWIVPRISATFITREAEGMLDKCHFKPWESISVHWDEAMPSLKSGLEFVQEDWIKSGVLHLSADTQEASLKRLIGHFVAQLEKKVIHLRLQEKQIPTNALHFLNNLIHPHNTLQERVLSWWTFQKDTDENIVHEMLRTIDVEHQGHLYCYLK